MYYKNYGKFLEDLKKAITDERTAINFYTNLLKVAPTETARFAVKTALDDEKVHNKKLTELYVHLTGRQPNVIPEEVRFHHFYDGLQKAFLGEVEAAEFYKELYLSTTFQCLRDIFYDIQHDETEHATLFNWVHTEISN